SFTDTASNESQRAADALRQTQATMILEMQQALEAATQRFNETASAMRATAKEVGSELENTRSELARGVMELPEETKSSAAAMRRVVAEQIEALAELNAIVRAQPATHDLNERRPAPSRPARDEAPSRPEPRPEPVRPEPTRAAELPRSEPARTASRYTAMPEVSAPVVTAPRPQPVAEAKPAAAAPKTEEGGGWLRDVLRNASGPSAAAAAPTPAAAAPTPAAAPTAAPQNLSTLTEEIAKAMEPSALADAWQRYQAGEQNVFSRRIYTLGGQATYDEVRKRIQRDSDFAKTAATYMAEFEQLLKRAATGTNPAGETREYLLSDRGRVYTMLAHASGRLG
ncbi:MAG: hypothetical protein JNK01_24005, partial [Devosia sp.]|nr:hypothetical protein [Devosia sp.]